MLNFLRPGMARLLSPVGHALARTPVTPNMITVIGAVGVSGAALSMFPIGELFPGALTATVCAEAPVLPRPLPQREWLGSWQETGFPRTHSPYDYNEVFYR